MPREVIAQPTDRNDVAVKNRDDMNGNEESNRMQGVETSVRASRLYETTRISGRSHLVQGDVFNTHNHIYGSKVTWHSVENADGPSVNDGSGLYSTALHRNAPYRANSGSRIYQEKGFSRLHLIIQRS